MTKVENIDKAIYSGLVILVISLSFSIAVMSAVWVYLILAWVLKIIIMKKYQFVRTEIDIPIALLVIATIISALNGLDPFNSLRALKQTALVSIFYIIVNNVKEQNQVKKLIFLFIICSVLSALVGFVQYFAGIKAMDGQIVEIPYKFLTKLPPKVLDFLAMEHGRVLGTRSHPLTYAESLMMAIVLSFPIMLRSRSRKQNIYLSLGIIIMLYSLFFTNSRGPWIATSICILIAGFFRIKKFMAFMLILVLIISISAASAGILIKGERNSIITRLKTIKNWRQDRDSLERTLMWKSGIRIFRDYPLFGIGVKNIHLIYQKYKSPEATHENENELHSNFIQVAVERGILGLIAFLWIMLTFLIKTIKGYREILSQNYLAKGILLGGILSFSSFYLAGFTETTFNDSEIIGILYTIMGLIYIMKIDSSKIKELKND